MAEAFDDEEARELDRLARFLTRPGPRFGLGLAIVRDPRVGRELRERLERDVGVSVAMVRFRHEDDREDLVAKMIEVGQGSDALFVVGLDRLLVDELGRPRTTSAVANLNQRRDSLPDLLDVRVVFWLGREAYSSFRKQAWDLNQIMLTIAEFERRAEVEVERRVGVSWPGGVHVVDEDGVAAKLAQARNLARLAEQQAGDRRSFADAAIGAGLAYLEAGDIDEASRWIELTASTWEDIDEPGEAAVARGLLGSLLRVRGDEGRAWDETERAVRLATDAGDEPHKAKALTQLAKIQANRGQLTDALRTVNDDVLPIHRRASEVDERARGFGDVVDFMVDWDQLDSALRIIEHDWLPALEQLGDVRARAVAQTMLARVLILRGDLDDALKILRTEVIPVLEGAEALLELANAFGLIADVQRARGELDEAIRIRRERQLAAMDHLGNVVDASMARVDLARDLLRRQAAGDVDEARALLEVAVTSTRRLGLKVADDIAAELAQIRQQISASKS